jgi:uncharacterized protein (DUF2141 family)
MKKIFFIMLIYISSLCYSQTNEPVSITIEITNIAVNGGYIYMGVFSSAESFNNDDPILKFRVADNNTVMTQEITVANGEYLITVFQDTNNNQKLDFGLLGIPKELLGITNYFGHGFPSRNFNKHKIVINNLTKKVSIGLYRF